MPRRMTASTGKVTEGTSTRDEMTKETMRVKAKVEEGAVARTNMWKEKKEEVGAVDRDAAARKMIDHQSSIRMKVKRGEETTNREEDAEVDATIRDVTMRMVGVLQETMVKSKAQRCNTRQ